MSSPPEQTRTLQLAMVGHDGKKIREEEEKHFHDCSLPGGAGGNIRYEGICDGKGALNPLGTYKPKYSKKGLGPALLVPKE